MEKVEEKEEQGDGLEERVQIDRNEIIPLIGIDALAGNYDELIKTPDNKFKHRWFNYMGKDGVDSRYSIYSTKVTHNGSEFEAIFSGRKTEKGWVDVRIAHITEGVFFEVKQEFKQYLPMAFANYLMLKNDRK